MDTHQILLPQSVNGVSLSREASDSRVLELVETFQVRDDLDITETDVLNKISIQSSMYDDRENLSFVEDSNFQTIMGGIILCNLATLAIEADNPLLLNWTLVNILFLAIYLGEFSLRLLHHRAAIVSREIPLYLFYDAFVIILGIVDIFVWCATPPRSSRHGRFRAVNTDGKTEWAQFLLLSRLLRVPRIVRMYSPLQDFVNVLGSMAASFAWILAMIFLMCFVLAILLTRLVGQGMMVFTEDEELRNEATFPFRNMQASLFTLFQLTTTDDWSKMAGPLISVNHMWRGFFISFITFMSWTMLSLLTAVASESLISVASRSKLQESLEEEQRKAEFNAYLTELFRKADTNGTSTLDRTEFFKLMGDERIKMLLVDRGMSSDAKALESLWKTFDVDLSGSLTIDELLDGFSKIQEALNTAQVANLGYSLQQFDLRLTSCLDECDQMLVGSVIPLLESVRSHHEDIQSDWSKFLESACVEPEPPPPPPAVLTKGASFASLSSFRVTTREGAAQEVPSPRAAKAWTTMFRNPR